MSVFHGECRNWLKAPLLTRLQPAILSYSDTSTSRDTATTRARIESFETRGTLSLYSVILNN
jgi:hypothetical protein